jgi:hypothetical protein
MKKMAIVLAAALAITVAAPAFATEFIVKDGKLSGNYTITNGVLPTKANTSIGLGVATKGSENGWSAEAELGSIIGNTLSLGKYKVAITDPLFNLTIWGKDKDVSDKNDPFSFVKSSRRYATADGNMKVRAEVGPITVDFEDDSDLYVFADKQIAGHNLGIAAHSDLPLATNGATVVVHDRTEVAGVNLTGSLGGRVQPGQNLGLNNLGIGVKAESAIPVMPNLKGVASYKSQPAGFNGKDQDELFVEGTHETSQTKLAGSYTYTMKSSDRTQKVGDVITAAANWRGSANNQKWDDQFKAGKYQLNVAPAVQASVVRASQPAQDPTTKLVVKGTMPIIPGQLWANGSMENQLEQKKTIVSADAYYKMMEKLAVEPGMKITVQQGQDSQMNLGAKATYQVAKNGKLTAGYSINSTAGQKTGDQMNFGYEVKF